MFRQQKQSFFSEERGALYLSTAIFFSLVGFLLLIMCFIVILLVMSMKSGPAKETVDVSRELFRVLACSTNVYPQVDALDEQVFELKKNYQWTEKKQEEFAPKLENIFSTVYTWGGQFGLTREHILEIAHMSDYGVREFAEQVAERVDISCKGKAGDWQKVAGITYWILEKQREPVL